MTKLTENLKSARKNSRILQKDLAQFLGLPLRTYQSYEYGEAEPSLENLVKICQYFQVSSDYLLGLSETKERQP